MKQNYKYKKNSGLIFVNAAIVNDSREEMTFYTFKKEFLGGLSITEQVSYQQKSSFNKQWVLNQVPNEDVVEGALVTCMSMSSLCDKYSVDKDLNLLLIDAEGYDGQIIMSIDFSIVRPKAIIFEHHAMGDDYERLVDFLSQNGYQIKILGKWDAVAESLQ